MDVLGATLLQVAALAAAVSCGPNREQPIAVLVGPEWSDAALQYFQQSAESWNLEVGTRLTATRASNAPQQVRIKRSKLLCGFAVASASRSGDINICELDANRGFQANVVPHELGHLLGISHAEGSNSLMFEGGDAYNWKFTDEDLRLFNEANPSFAGRGGCDVVRRIGWSANRPLLVQSAGSRPVVVWTEPHAVRFAALDLHTAEAGSVSSIPTGSQPQLIRAVTTSQGFLVSWNEGPDLYITTVSGEEPSAPRKLEVDLRPLREHLLDLSLAILGSDLYVAVGQGSHSSTRSSTGTSASTAPDVEGLWLYRFELAGGGQRSFASPRREGRGQLTVVDGQILLVLLEGTLNAPRVTLKVERLGTNGERLEELTLLKGIDAGAGLQVHPRGDELLVGLREFQPPSSVEALGQVRLTRVGTKGTLMQVAKSTLEVPKYEFDVWRPAVPDLAFHETSGGIALALSHGGQTSLSEVWVTLIDPIRLTVAKPWLSLSTPDMATSDKPLLAGNGTDLIVVWSDSHERPDGLDLIRSRCLRELATSK